jgi:hypothetical protein
LEEEEKER